MKQYEKAAYTVINKCLSLKSSESILILADDPCIDTAKSLYEICTKRTKNAIFLQLPVRRHKLIKPVGALMQAVDCAVLLTATSLSHSVERRLASKKGTRIISMPNINMQTFCLLASMNFDKIARLSQKVSDILSMAHEVKITSANGSELNFTISKGKGFADTGIVRESGEFTNLPAGEASVCPDAGSCNGKLYVDCGMGIYGKETLKLIIKDGRAVRITGSEAARRLRPRLSKYGPNSRMVAEFGIGTNDVTERSGHVLLDEKLKGTVHVAIGNNVSFGGNNDVAIHMDAVIYTPNVVIDGRHILMDGRLLIE